MKPGARREYVRRLHTMADSVREMADKTEAAELPDLRRVGIGWGDNDCEIDVGGTYVFKMPDDEPHIVRIIRALAWGLFEARRDSGNPSDPKRLAEVRDILQDIGLEILGSWSLNRCSKCDNLRHICVGCNGEHKVLFSEEEQEEHDRTQVLCPKCSTWLAPQAPR